MSPLKLVKRYLIYPFEALLVFTLIAFFRILPVDRASAAGSAIAGFLGPRTGLDKKARKGLKIAFPEMEQAEVDRIVRATWDNLGRLCAEYPHLPTITEPKNGRIEIIDVEPLLERLISGEAVYILAGHFANFEICPRAAKHLGATLYVLARGPNNKILDRALKRWRGDATTLDKGYDGMMAVSHVLRKKGAAAQMIDQRQIDGIPVTFFGQTAMTNSAPARVSLHLNVPVNMCRVVRTGGVNFKLIFEEPIHPERSGDRDADIKALTQRYTDRIEAWVRDDPSQWFWVHSRWPNELYRQTELA